MSAPLLRPIDICDRCDGLFPLRPMEQRRAAASILEFKWVGKRRLCFPCVEAGKKPLDIR